MADDNDKRNNRPGSRPAGGAPIRQDAMAANPVAGKPRAFGGKKPFAKKPDEAGGRERPQRDFKPTGGGKPGGFGSSRPKPFAGGSQRARRATGARIQAADGKPARSGFKPGAQSPSSSSADRDGGGARVRLSRSARAPTATGRSSKRPDQRSGRPQAMQLRLRATIARSGPRGRRVARPGRPPRDRRNAAGPSRHARLRRRRAPARASASPSGWRAPASPRAATPRR